MQMLELALAIFGLCSAIMLAVTWVVSGRNPTIRAATLILRQRLKAENALQEQFGEALQPAKVLVTIANLIGANQTEYERKLALIGAVIFYELEKCDRIRACFDKSDWPETETEGRQP